jgi:hypothetical protein
MLNLNDIFLSEQTGGQGLLGHQLLLSMIDPGKSLLYEAVCECMEQTGFERYMPNPPNVKDAWRRATGIISGTRQLSDTDWCKLTLIRVNESKDPIERVVQATLVDKEGREVSEGKNIARLLFYSETQQFEVEDLYYTFNSFDQASYVGEFAWERITRAQSLFAEEKNSISIESVRLILRRILMSLGNTYKRIDSAWCVLTPKQDGLDRFVTLLSLLTEHAKALTGVEEAFYCVTTPIYNSVEQRTQVRKDFIHHALQILSQAREAASQPLTNNVAHQGKQANRRIEKLDREIEALQKHADMYRGILQDGLKEIDEAVQKARDEVRAQFREFQNEIYIPSSSPEGTTRNIRTNRPKADVSDTAPTIPQRPTRNIRVRSDYSDGGLFQSAAGGM